MTGNWKREISIDAKKSRCGKVAVSFLAPFGYALAMPKSQTFCN
jgi:hypothetical protein